MKQYCRYCAFCCYGDEVYCEKHNKTMSEERAKRTNECKDFAFNEIDVFNPEQTYKERKPKENNEMSLFDFKGE